MDWRVAYLPAKPRMKEWESLLASSLETLDSHTYDTSKSLSLLTVSKSIIEIFERQNLNANGESETRRARTLR